MKMPLTSGAYAAASLIASAQRCVNLYPEQNPPEAEFPFTHYPTPGLIQRATAPLEGFRGLYTASSGDLYAVVADTVYRIGPGFDFQELGHLQTDSGPVSMKDNSLNLAIVDGSAFGFSVDLETFEFAPIIDPAFYGSNRADVIDDFFLFNQPGTRQFYASGALALTFDPLDIAAKNGAPDKTVAVAIVDRIIFVMGERTIEPWFNAGGADFTFSRYTGAFIEHGCASAASIGKSDTSIYWLSTDEAGLPIVMRSNDMTAVRISTHALEHEIKGYPSIADAYGFCYQDRGHTFYMLTFPSAERTWCFDLATGQWHERGFLQPDGTLTRHRAACLARWNGMILAGDYETDALYEMTTSAFDDAGTPQLHIRSWPTLSNEKEQIDLSRFAADMEVGESALNVPEPLLRLRWSDDRGRTWSNHISRGLGNRGEYNRTLTYNRCGMSRERIFELSWSASVKTALNGAYCNPQAGA